MKVCKADAVEVMEVMCKLFYFEVIILTCILILTEAVAQRCLFYKKGVLRNFAKFTGTQNHSLNSLIDFAYKKDSVCLMINLYLQRYVSF